MKYILTIILVVAGLSVSAQTVDSIYMNPPAKPQDKRAMLLSGHTDSTAIIVLDNKILPFSHLKNIDVSKVAELKVVRDDNSLLPVKTILIFTTRKGDRED